MTTTQEAVMPVLAPPAPAGSIDERAGVAYQEAIAAGERLTAANVAAAQAAISYRDAIAAYLELADERDRQ